MNLRDLKYLVNTAKEGHFARAAQMSFISQPTLSMQIKKLEDELGVEIFERQNKKILVTPIGKEILKKAEIILREADEIKILAKNSADPYAGELSIGAFPTIAPYFLPNIVRKISKEFPKLKLILIEDKTNQLIEKLKNGELDAALIAMPLHNNEFEGKKIFEEEFLLAVPQNHSFAKKKIIKQKELENEKLILLEDGHCLRDQALAVCARIGAGEQTFRATSLETLKQMIIAGSGITLIPEIAAKKETGISYIKIEKAPKRIIGFYFRKSSPKTSLIGKIGDGMRER